MTNVISVEIYEPIHPGWTADSTAVTADSTFYTADGGPLIGATEVTDAEVISEALPGEPGGYYPRPPLRIIAAAVAETANAGDVLEAFVTAAAAVAETANAGDGFNSALVTAVAAAETANAIDVLDAARLVESSLHEVAGAVDQADAVNPFEDDAGMILTFLLAA